MYQDYTLPDSYEDCLYQNTSSSEDEGIDSETEAELYAQVHYAEDLSTLDSVDVVREGGNEGDKGHDKRDNKLERECGEQNQGGTEGRTHTVGTDEGDEDVDRAASLADPPKHQAHTVSLPGNPTSSGSHTKAGLSGSREEEGVGRTERPGKAKRSRAERWLLKTPRSVVATDLDGEHDSDGSGISDYQILDGRTITGDELLQLNVVGKKARASGQSSGDPIRSGEEKEDAAGDARHWEVDERDLEAQSGKFQRSRYYRDISLSRVRCRNCDQNGHLSKVCPKPLRKSACFLCGGRDHQSTTCPNAACHYCHTLGHQTRFCKGRFRCAESVCLRCHWKGHLARDCPELWRQYHSTTTVGTAIVKGSDDQNNNIWCYNCGTQGHFGHNCPEAPVCKYLYPSAPFVTVYGDNAYWRGNKRKFDAGDDSYQSHNKKARRHEQTPHGTRQNFQNRKKPLLPLPKFVQTAVTKVTNKLKGKKKAVSGKKKKWLQTKNQAMNSEEAYESQLMAYDLKQLDQRCKSNFKRNANKKKKKIKQKIQQGGAWTDPRDWRGVRVHVGDAGRQVTMQQTQGRRDAAAKSKKRQKKDRKRARQQQDQQAWRHGGTAQAWGHGGTAQACGHGGTAQAKKSRKFVSAQGFASAFRGFKRGREHW